ncbi:MAG: hypothetical protein M3440_08240 [Chloroflexota bacterium]|nr:hypothetical protein [Chloroflexota bacterium]
MLDLLAKVPPEMRITSEVMKLNGAPALMTRDRSGIERIVTLDVHDGWIAAVRMIPNPDKLRHLGRSLRESPT